MRATAATKLKPKPEPGVLRERSKRTKRSRTRSRSASGMPGPLSRTEKVGRSSRGLMPVDTVTEPPCGVYFNAFSTRFAAARASRLRLPRTVMRDGATKRSVTPRSSAAGS